jgi:hypothetical protein
MVELQISEGKLVVQVQGADRFWALKSTLEIPLEHVAGIRADPEIAHGWWHGFRAPGTEIPGVITAGTFYHHGERIFWDVHHPEKTVVITLRHEKYAELIVEVADPDAAVKELSARLG